ncbi:MAG: flagellar basal body-associated FliL family protein [Bacillota bacterium]
MADEVVNEEAGKEPKVNPNTIKMIIAGVVMIILAAGISFGVATFAMKTAAPPAEKGEGYGKTKTEKLEATLDIGEFITNVKDKNAASRYVKIRIVLDLPSKVVEEEVNNKLPQVQHTINTVLRSQSVENLMADNATEKLAETLKKRINELLLKGNVNNVYFTSFVVQ